MISWMPPTSHWRCDDHRDPDCDHWRWSWSILFGSTRLLLIFGSEEDGALTAADLTTCSYTTALLHKSEHYSATTPPQPQLKMIKKTLTMNSCCAPSTTTPRWCLKSCCCSRLFASSWWRISFCSAAKLNIRASLNRKPPICTRIFKGQKTTQTKIVHLYCGFGLTTESWSVLSNLSYV